MRKGPLMFGIGVVFWALCLLVLFVAGDTQGGAIAALVLYIIGAIGVYAPSNSEVRHYGRM